MAQNPFAVIPLNLGTITAGNQQTAKPASNLGEFNHIGMTWRSNLDGSLWVRGDFGSSKRVNFCSLLHANAITTSRIRLRLGATQADVDGTAPYDSGEIGIINPVAPRADNLYSSHLEIPAVQIARWWRIDIFAGAAADFEAAKLILGEKLTFANYYSPGFEFGTEDLGDIDIGRWGVPEITDGLIFRRLTCKFGWMSQSDMDTNFRPLVERVGKRTPIFFCMDPEATVNRQARSYFGWLKEPPYFTGAVNKFDRFESEWSIISMI